MSAKYGISSSSGARAAHGSGFAAGDDSAAGGSGRAATSADRRGSGAGGAGDGAGSQLLQLHADGGVGGGAVLRVLAEEDEIVAAIIAERDEKITAAEQDVRDIVELFKDMAVMVGQQGDGVVQVAKNVEEAEVRTRAGVQEVRRAKEIHDSTPCVIQ